MLASHLEQKAPMVRDLPVRERPVNRLREVGPGALSGAEVIAAILQTPDALTQAQKLLAEFEGLDGLARAHEYELTRIEGIGPSQAARFKAAFELGRRFMAITAENQCKICRPSDAAYLLMPEIGMLEREVFVVLFLDTRNRLTGRQMLYVGTLNASQIRVGEVFQEAIRRNAAAIVVAHNHPSDDPAPSPEDVAITRELVAAGKLLDIELLDHLVVCRQQFVSLRERGLGFAT